jgi:hypothetical protein
MTDVPFHTTRMGHTYYGHTLPELVTQITRLADALERIADTGSVDAERAKEPQAPEMEKP